MTLKKFGWYVVLLMICHERTTSGFFGFKFNLFGPPYTIDMTKALTAKNVMPLVIIGSGPAALSAAIYGGRSQMPTLVIRGNKPGGALTETTYIENWPGIPKKLGPDVMQALHDQAKEFGVEFIDDAVDSVDFNQWPFSIHTENGKTISALTVVIGTGSSPRLLGIPGEKAYWGKGVTTCAICDAPFHKGHDVIVIGGGDSAAEEAMQLAPYVKNVTIMVRKDSMRAAASMQERLKEYPNINIQYNTVATEILGNGAHVENVTLQDTKTNKTSTLPVRGVFLAIGHDPNTKVFKEYLKIDAEGYISLVGRSQHTSLPGVFAAGDVEDAQYKQAGVASGDGIKAGLDAIGFLQEHGFSTKVAKQLENRLFDSGADGSLQVEKVSTVKALDSVFSSEKRLVVLDFYASYCPSCMQMLPAVERVAFQLADSVVFYKVNMDDAQELADKYNVKSIPALLVFDTGQIAGRSNEAMSRKQLFEFLQKFIKK